MVLSQKQPTEPTPFSPFSLSPVMTQLFEVQGFSKPRSDSSNPSTKDCSTEEAMGLGAALELRDPALLPRLQIP